MQCMHVSVLVQAQAEDNMHAFTDQTCNWVLLLIPQLLIPTQHCQLALLALQAGHIAASVSIIH